MGDGETIGPGRLSLREQELVLDALRDVPHLESAAADTGVPFSAILGEYRENPEFARAVFDATAHGKGRMVGAVWRRGRDGFEKLTAAGKAYVEFDNGLSAFLLRSIDPAGFNRRPQPAQLTSEQVDELIAGMESQLKDGPGVA